MHMTLGGLIGRENGAVDWATMTDPWKESFSGL